MNWDKKRIAIIAFFVLVASTCDIRACIVTFINDSGNKIAIQQPDDEAFITLDRHKKRRMGDADSHTSFTIYIPESNHSVFRPAYLCEQVSCSATNSLELKFSDIKNGTGTSDLFKITEYNPHESMVQRVLKKMR